MLDSRKIRMTRSAKKLDYQRLGPFKVKRVVKDGAAYELKIPKCFGGMFPVFHPWLLHFTDQEPTLGQEQTESPTVRIDEEQESAGIVDGKFFKAEIDALDLEKRKESMKYKVVRNGHSKLGNKPWEPYWRLFNFPDEVIKFHKLRQELPLPKEFKKIHGFKTEGSRASSSLWKLRNVRRPSQND